MSFVEDLLDWINANYRIGMDPLEMDEQLTHAADVKLHKKSFPENYVDDKQKFEFHIANTTINNADGKVSQIVLQQIVSHSGKNFYLQNPAAKTIGYSFKITKKGISGLFILNLPPRFQLQINLFPITIEAKEIPAKETKEQKPKEQPVTKKPIHSEPPKPSSSRKISFVPHVVDFILDREVSPAYEELQYQLISQWKRKTEKELKIDENLLKQLIILHYKAAIEETSVDLEYLTPITNNFEKYQAFARDLNSKDECNEMAMEILSNFKEEEFQEFTTIICSYVDFIGEPTAVVIIGKVKDDHPECNISFTPTIEQLSNIILSNINTIRINKNLTITEEFTLNHFSEETINDLDKSQLTLSKPTSVQPLKSNNKGLCFIYLIPSDKSFADIINLVFDDKFTRGSIGQFNNFGIAIQSVQVGETNCTLIAITILSSKFSK
ncbi:hypothetical protein TVAG_132240 [Trichomonas vaginalis G3]|uniref:Uncharacterized protein n=1 Tax=Trichomonas vaginalis (strain ATCC PRA-98 / G3) TaxID=412133 RepID=A2FNK7_TRIV3|nr:hypothetical protein TVAGG3_0735870 [Trichomonas vaginalis G3]EAX93507.1 hypothetical protein TVAG_132240 [Trichomonas vaginalis G3]KAI5511580.1 hypothetical protein TVAGG3_0735870 [Trichomonas vaginalis G3]|eukprot:XP_001306437.1 hypothetical protein [Trichomonas vaginalis G3]